MANKKSFSKYMNSTKRVMKLIALIAVNDSHRLNAIKEENPQNALSLTESSKDEIFRSAIVLSVASIDAYFTDRFIELLIPFLKRGKPTPKLISLFEKSGLDTKSFLKLMTTKRPLIRLRNIVTIYLEKRSFQNFKAIDDLYLCYGYKNFSSNIQKYNKETNQLKRIEKIVKRRHSIVHDGDYTARGKLREIDAREVSKFFEDILDFVAGAEFLLKQKFSKKNS